MKDLSYNTNYTREVFFNKHIIPFMGSRKISTLNKVTWLELIAHLEGKELKPNSVKDIMQVVKALFSWWADNNDVCNSPFVKCRLPKGEKVKHTRLDEETTMYLISIARPIETVILALGTMDGFRKGEMLGLEWSDIDFTNNTIHVQRSWNGKDYSIKNETSRATLAMPPLVAEILKKWRKENTHFKYVLPGQGGLKPMSTPMPNFYLNTLLKRGGVEHITVHELRHSCAHVLLKAGENMHFVQKYMRHANIQITVNLYGDLDDGVTVHTARRMAKIYTDLTDKMTDKKENTGS
jgi:integrase